MNFLRQGLIKETEKNTASQHIYTTKPLLQPQLLKPQTKNIISSGNEKNNARYGSSTF